MVPEHDTAAGTRRRAETVVVHAGQPMSVVRERIEGMTPADLLAFEAAHPRWGGNKETVIRVELGLTPARYTLLLIRAAESAEGIAADPLTARRVREQGQNRRRAA